MKVLFVSSWYPTEKNPNYGVFVKEHAKAIQTTKNTVVVLAIVIHRSKKWFSTIISEFQDENDVRTIIVEINTRFRDIVYHAVPLQYFILQNIFRRRVKPDFTPDIVHSNVIFPAGIIGSWLSKSLKIPHVITEHWTRVRNFSDMFLLASWGRAAYQHAFRILPVSRFLQHEIMDSFSITSEQKFKVVGNVIDPKTFYFKEKETHPTEIRLCAIATWAYLKYPAKYPELLIEALSVLQPQINKSITLTMVGGGNKVDELKELCQTMGINAQFTGYLDKSEIVKRLHDSDFFVHPTRIETFGVVVAEALLTGTPVVCSNVEALRELISDSNGECCENTVEDWVRGLKKAFNSNYDRKQISLNIASKYERETISCAINQVYEELLK